MCVEISFNICINRYPHACTGISEKCGNQLKELMICIYYESVHFVSKNVAEVNARLWTGLL